MATRTQSLQDLGRRPAGGITWAALVPPVLLAAPTVLILVTFFVVPLAYMAVYSVWRYDPARLVVPMFTWDNYATFLADPYSRGIVFRTLRVASLTTAFSLLLGYPLAYYMTRVRGVEKTVLVMWVLWPLMVSPVIQAYGWLVLIAPHTGALSVFLRSVRLLSGPLPLMTSEWGIVLGLTHNVIAFMVLSLHSALEAVDPNLLRAAAVLSARPVQVFTKVLLPLSLPGIISGCLLVFALSSSAFMTPFLLTGRTLPMLAVYAYDLNMTSLNWPLGAATGIIALLISLISLLVLGASLSRLRARRAA